MTNWTDAGSVWIVTNPSGRPGAVLAREDLAEKWLAENPTTTAGCEMQAWTVLGDGTARPGHVRTEAAAVCSLGAYEHCRWSFSGTEDEITTAAGEHATENPGHRVSCQVRETRTWAMQEDPR